MEIRVRDLNTIALATQALIPLYPDVDIRFDYGQKRTNKQGLIIQRGVLRCRGNTKRKRGECLHGQRRTARGSVSPGGCTWSVHWDWMSALFVLEPDARIKSMMAEYNGQAEFYAKAGKTGDHVVGSVHQPAKFGDL